MRYRIKYETRGFDEYLNIYNNKNKLAYYSVEVDYSRPKRLLYSNTQERITIIDFSTDDIDDLFYGYPILYKGEKLGYYDDNPSMEATGNVEFAHVVGPDWSFIELSERLIFRDYVVKDSNGEEIMKIKRAGTDFVCDINTNETRDIQLLLSIACVEYWKYITTTREF